MKRLFTFHMLFFFASALFAQAKKEQIRFVAGMSAQIDGQLVEWTEYMNLIGEDTALWSYAIGYDAKNLYVAVKVIDPALQLEAAAHGISVMINSEGKRKEGMQLTFPVPDAETIRSMLEEGDFSSANVRPALIARSRGYKVKGFPKIVDGLLSLQNTYGVQAVAQIDTKDHLVYESAIPLAQLGLNNTTKSIAVQVAIQNRWNQMPKTTMRSQQVRTRQRTTTSVKSPYKGKTEVWVIDQLLIQ